MAKFLEIQKKKSLMILRFGNYKINSKFKIASSFWIFLQTKFCKFFFHTYIKLFTPNLHKKCSLLNIEDIIAYSMYNI